jgi:hypothetical protein
MAAAGSSGNITQLGLGIFTQPLRWIVPPTGRIAMRHRTTTVEFVVDQRTVGAIV